VTEGARHATERRVHIEGRDLGMHQQRSHGALKESTEAHPEEADPNPDTHEPLSRVLALHLRRGDYKEHCEMLSVWGSGYLGVNEAEGFVDR
jgi:hypothetical protein